MNKRYINNLLNGLQYRFENTVRNPYRKLKLSRLEVMALKHSTAGKLRQTRLLNATVYHTDPKEFLFGLKEIFIDKIYEQQLSESPMIIDCGANIGLSIIYFKNAYPNANIVAFEPDEKNFALLQKNIDAFTFVNVILHQSAVWISNDPLQFSVTGTMGSSIVTQPNGSNTVTVQGFRLKDLLTKKIDFLKIDIEGAEYAVLKDIASALHWVQNLFIEYHGTFAQNKELIEMLGIIEANGFQFYIKEAASVYDHPFTMHKVSPNGFDVQLNIFCIKSSSVK